MSLRKVTIVLVVLLTAMYAGAQAPPAKPAAKSGGWTPLFPGNSLDGWEIVPIGAGGGQYAIEDGVLKITRQPPDRGASWLVSRKDYEDFLLRVKFRPNGTDYVTGLLIRDPGHAKIGRPAFNGFEVVMQRNPNDENVDGAIYHVANAFFTQAAPDAWTTIEVHCIGDHMEVFLNGKKTSEAHTRRSYKGGIGFHLHGGDAAVNWEFKDAEIKELPPAPHPYRLLEEKLSVDPRPSAPVFQSMDDFTGNSSAFTWNNKILTAAPADGDAQILTKESLANFLLDFEFRLKPGGNAGVLFRVPDGGAADAGYEFHMGDAKSENPNGSLFNLARAFSVNPDNRPIVAPGAWARGRVFAEGDHLVTYIASEKGIDIHAKRSMKGHIGFKAAAGSSVEFRNISVKRLDGKP